jgi:hypothetical protein
MENLGPEVEIDPSPYRLRFPGLPHMRVEHKANAFRRRPPRGSFRTLQWPSGYGMVHDHLCSWFMTSEQRQSLRPRLREYSERTG